MDKLLNEARRAYPGDPGRAFQLMAQAIDMESRAVYDELPDEVEVWHMRGGVFLARGLFAEALECLERGLRRSPNEPCLLLMQVSCLHQTGQSGPATLACCRALEFHPTNAALWGWLAQLVPENQTLEVLRRGYDATGAPEMLHALATKLQAAIRYAELVALLESLPPDAVTIPILEHARHRLALNHQEELRSQAARLLKRGECEKALEMARSLDDTELASEALEMMGRHAEAASLLTLPSRRKGQLLRKAGDVQAAMEIYARIVEQHPHPQHRLDASFWREYDTLAGENGEPSSAVFEHNCGALMYLDELRLEAHCTDCSGSQARLQVGRRWRWPEFLRGGGDVRFQLQHFWPLAERHSGEVEFQDLLEPLKAHVLATPIGKQIASRYSSKSSPVWGLYPGPRSSHNGSELRVQLAITPEMIPALTEPVVLRVLAAGPDNGQGRYEATLEPGSATSNAVLKPVRKPPQVEDLLPRAPDALAEQLAYCALSFMKDQEHPYFRQRWMSAPSFVGGKPMWMHNPVRKKCKRCKGGMKFLAQIASRVCCDDSLQLELWPNPCLYVFFCPKDLSVQVELQS